MSEDVNSSPQNETMILRRPSMTQSTVYAFKSDFWTLRNPVFIVLILLILALLILSLGVAAYKVYVARFGRVSKNFLFSTVESHHKVLLKTYCIRGNSSPAVLNIQYVT